MDRRHFLGVIAAAVLAGCDDTLRASFGRAALQPAGAPRRLMALDALTPTPTAVPFATSDGGEAVYAYRDGEAIVVLSTLCTHRGCAVRWDGTEKFSCPCHDGHFDKRGAVLSGPPLAPLRSYAPQVVGSDLFIQA